jgi:hypothetical protein
MRFSKSVTHDTWDEDVRAVFSHLMSMPMAAEWPAVASYYRHLQNGDLVDWTRRRRLERPGSPFYVLIQEGQDKDEVRKGAGAVLLREDYQTVRLTPAVRLPPPIPQSSGLTLVRVD